MKLNFLSTFLIVALFLIGSCQMNQHSPREMWAEDLIGNPDYRAISYGGYREISREVVPTVDHIKEDMKILAAMGVKIVRTYNTQQFEQASNLLKAIRELKQEDPSFEMYVMLGAWIDCKDAWSDAPDHDAESLENNQAEINAAIEMANEYPDIVKIIAVGNEAMVHWATSYYVHPRIILKWVNHLQALKESGGLPSKIWITSSDNFASWGGADNSYHIDDLTELIRAVDFVSIHTYPFHDTHYNPSFWVVPEAEESLSDLEKTDAAMIRAVGYAKTQYQAVVDYVENLGIRKPFHIGETGWSTMANTFYDAKGSRAADEYKEKLYYQHMREWTDTSGISCVYFEAFDEQWKDRSNSDGPENHFGLINLQGEAKFVLWDLVDEGVFKGLERNGLPISKTYGGDEKKLLSGLLPPPSSDEIGLLTIHTVNEKRNVGDRVSEGTYIVVSDFLVPDSLNNRTYPSASLKLNPWEGTCAIEMSPEGIITVETGANGWWGCGLEIQSGGFGEDLSEFKSGKLHFQIKGDTQSSFNIGFQTGRFSDGTQSNNFVEIGPGKRNVLTIEWQYFTVPISTLNRGADLKNVTSLIYLMSATDLDGKHIFLKNIYYTKE